MAESADFTAQLRELSETLSQEEAQAALEMVHYLKGASESQMGLVGDLMGIKILEKRPGFSRCGVAVAKKLFNPYGVLHGAVLFAMIDYGMGAALSGTLRTGELSATIEIKINYLAAVTSGNLHCDTNVIQRGNRVAVLESRVIGDDERLVAMATGSFYIIRPRQHTKEA